MIETATKVQATNETPVREARPFLRLEPTSRPSGLTDAAREGLGLLEQSLVAQIPELVRSLVEFTIRGQRDQAGWRGQSSYAAPSVSVLNRRRRAARLWIQAIVGGKVDEATLHSIAHSLVPQLAGTGPEVHRGVCWGRDCIEYLRGAATALIMWEPANNLVPEAKALNALECVLANHLAAIESTAAEPTDI